MDHEKPKLPSWVPILLVLAVLLVIGCGGGLALFGFMAFRVHSSGAPAPPAVIDAPAIPEMSVEQVPEESPAAEPASGVEPPKQP